MAEEKDIAEILSEAIQEAPPYMRQTTTTAFKSRPDIATPPPAKKTIIELIGDVNGRLETDRTYAAQEIIMKLSKTSQQKLFLLMSKTMDESFLKDNNLYPTTEIVEVAKETIKNYITVLNPDGTIKSQILKSSL